MAPRRIPALLGLALLCACMPFARAQETLDASMFVIPMDPTPAAPLRPLRPLAGDVGALADGGPAAAAAGAAAAAAPDSTAAANTTAAANATAAPAAAAPAAPGAPAVAGGAGLVAMRCAGALARGFGRAPWRGRRTARLGTPCPIPGWRVPHSPAVSGPRSRSAGWQPAYSL